MSRRIEILLVEDNPADIRLTEEAFKGISTPLHLSVTPDGAEALAFLRREGRYAAAPRPDLILLDLNLPRKSGRDVLAEVKGDADLGLIPILMLTTSQAPSDIEQAYDLGANAYMVKSGDIDHFFEQIERLDEFWLRHVTFATAPSAPVASVEKFPAGKTVLVIDDSATIVTYVRLTLEQAGYTVLAALGEEALRLAEERQPQVVLLDMNMPLLDGTQISRALRDNPLTAGIPIVVMSTQHGLRASAALLPGNDWLPKPLDHDALLATIERWATAGAAV